MMNPTTNTPPEAVRAFQSDVPAPTVHIDEYGCQRAVCGLCERDFKPSGYRRHFKQVHLGIKAARPDRIKRYPERQQKPRRRPTEIGDFEMIGNMRWRKMSQDSIAKILANYPK